MLDDKSPQFRAVVKMMLLLTSAAAIGALISMGFHVIGAYAMFWVIGIVIFGYIMKTFYDIQLGQELYRDQLKNTRDTLRGEQRDQT
jgi:type III secretory pathway component EscU